MAQNPDQVIAWVRLGGLITEFGVSAVQRIAAAVRETGATETELNAIITDVQDDAIRRKALADKDSELPE